MIFDISGFSLHLDKYSHKVISDSFPKQIIHVLLEFTFMILSFTSKSFLYMIAICVFIFFVTQFKLIDIKRPVDNFRWCVVIFTWYHTTKTFVVVTALDQFPTTTLAPDVSQQIEAHLDKLDKYTNDQLHEIVHACVYLSLTHGHGVNRVRQHDSR